MNRIKKIYQAHIKNRKDIMGSNDFLAFGLVVEYKEKLNLTEEEGKKLYQYLIKAPKGDKK